MIKNIDIDNIDRTVGYLDCMHDCEMLSDEIYQDALVKMFNVRSVIESHSKPVRK